MEVLLSRGVLRLIFFADWNHGILELEEKAVRAGEDLSFRAFKNFSYQDDLSFGDFVSFFVSTLN